MMEYMISETQTLETDGIVSILVAVYQRQILETPAKDGTTLCDKIASQLLTCHHRASFFKKNAAMVLHPPMPTARSRTKHIYGKQLFS